MEKILVSACLLGIDSKYDGENNKNEKILKLMDKYILIPFCPEIMGGLSTPREPSEIVNDKVLSSSGIDVTKEFVKGAKESLKLAKIYNIKKAIMKSKSPSCGYNKIYDGTFSHRIIKGDGVTAKLFLDNGIKIFTEEDI